RDPVAGAGVRAGERPPAQLAVGDHAVGLHALDLGGALPVLQLADVEVAPVTLGRLLQAPPPEEDVARCLHHVLACHDALSVAGVPALLGALPPKRSMSLL